MELIDRLSSALSGRYEVERELGRGGMAIVFLARDGKYDRHVAIKVLRPELAQSLGSERFLREIQIAAQLQHPHILPLYDSGEANGLLYYVMPYVEGESLRARLGREKQLSSTEALDIATDVGEALSYANSQGIVHRDIKPENILLFGDDALVADFGIAHAVSEAGAESLTESGVVIGTPAYMSPEQAGGERDLDGRSDVYALGCVLYEMLSGEPPFTGRTAQAVLARHMRDQVPSLEVIRPTLPFGIVDVVERSLEKVPADRFRTAQQLVEAIRVCETGTAPRRKLRRPRRRALWAAAMGLLVVAGATATVVFDTGRPIDANRIVAFPLEVTGEPPGVPGMGIDVASVMVGILDGWGELIWAAGADLADGPSEEQTTPLSVRDMRGIARDAGAGFFVRGRMILVRETVQLLLELHDVTSEQPIQRSDTSGARDEYLNLGLGAVAPLLLSLLPEDQAVDAAAVAGRSTEAVQAFVQGERFYRQGKFFEAREHYESALEHDSLFALAAFKAAKAATWNDALPVARGILEIAVRHRESLSPRDAHLTLGLDAYLNGFADSALYHLRIAQAMAPNHPDAWIGIGQVYRHLIPFEEHQDSMALRAFEQAHVLSPSFRPALAYLLARRARDGDTRSASRMLDEFRVTEPDSDEVFLAELVVRCVAESPDVIDWRTETLRDANAVFQAARVFHIGVSQPDCALAGWRAVIEHDTTSAPDHRFSAAVGLQALLAALGRTGELEELLDSRQIPASIRWLYIADALAGLDVRDKANAAAAQIRGTLWPTSTTRLWPLAVWDAHVGQLSEAHEVLDTLRARAAGDDASRTDSLLARSVTAHVVLAEGDTTEALAILRSLVPIAPRPGLTWQPWLSLGYEWLVLARLLEARGELEEALRIATIADAPGSVSNVIFLPQNLALRARVARALGRDDVADVMESRLRQLSQY